MVSASYPEAYGTASEQGHLTDDEDPNPRAEPCLWIGRRVTVPEWRPQRSHFFSHRTMRLGQLHYRQAALIVQSQLRFQMN